MGDTTNNPDRGIAILTALLDVAGDGEHSVSATVVGCARVALATTALSVGHGMVAYDNDVYAVLEVLRTAANGQHPAAVILHSRLQNLVRRRTWIFTDGTPHPLSAAEALQAAIIHPVTRLPVAIPDGVFFEDAPPLSVPPVK